VLSALLPNYLLDFLKLAPTTMGFVLSGIGFGGFVGQFGVPGLSDLFGRRTMAAIGFLGAAASVWLFMQTGPNPTMLFALLFVMSFCTLGNIALITGPIATESAPAGLISAAIGVVVGAGEIFGGGVMPAVAGFVAGHYGIENILLLPLLGLALGIIVSAFLKETAPRKVGMAGAPPLSAAAARQP